MDSRESSRPPRTVSRPVSYILVTLFLGATVFVMELFTRYDWGHGVARAILLALLGCLFFGLVVASRYIRLDLKPNAALKWILIAAVAVLFVFHIVVGIKAVRRTVKTDSIVLDQGQSTYRAIQMLLKGWSPYDQTIVLDRELYSEQIRTLYRKSECLVSFSIRDKDKNLNRYWRYLRPDDMALLFPKLAQTDECVGLNRAFETLGYKYGPGLLALYFPFVYLFGKAGIYGCHILLFVAAFVAVALFAYRHSDKSAVIAALSLLVVTAPSVLRHNILNLSATDLGPALLAILSPMLIQEKRERTAALCIGLSVTTKLLPGLLFVPLLLFIKKRNWIYFAIPIVLLYTPFLVHEFLGMANNLFIFNIVRSTDSTSLAHFLPPIAGTILSGAVALLLLVMVFRMIGKQWTMERALFYLLAANLGVLLAGRIFHNNYLIWLLPLFAMILVHSLKPAPIKDAATMRPSAAIPPG